MKAKPLATEKKIKKNVKKGLTNKTKCVIIKTQDDGRKTDKTRKEMIL